jgi:Polyketide cyclase / dehydrase and lipid transport
VKPVTVSTSVTRPPSDAFEYLDVLANHELFLDHFLVDWSFEGPTRGVGARAKARTDAPGGQDWTEFEVVSVEPGREIVEEGVGAGGKRRTRGTYRLGERADGGTAIEFELEWVEASKAERFGSPLTRAFIRRVNSKAMRRLAKILDG